MKKFIGFMAAASLLLSACVSGVSSDTAQESPAQTAGQSAPAPYFSGDGLKGVSLAILVPQGQGLPADQAYLPAMTQGVFVGDFSKYSALSILDRQNLDKVIAENYSGYYEEDHPDLNKLGHLLPTDYIMTGSITKTASGYALQMQISDNQSGMTKASYSGTCTIGEFDGFTGIRRASAELLAALGVALTDGAKQELSAGSTEAQVGAQTALAKGITAAQRGGSLVEVMDYYAQAVSEDEHLSEANTRLSALQNQIETGDFGAAVRGEIEQRNAWKKLLEDTAAYYTQHPVFDIIYNTAMRQGAIDFKSNRATVSFDVWLAPNPRFNTMMKILSAYWKMGKESSWKLRDSYRALVQNDQPSIYSKYFNFELLDAAGIAVAVRENDFHYCYIWSQKDGKANNNDGPEGNSFVTFFGFTIDLSVAAKDISPAMFLGFKGFSRGNALYEPDLRLIPAAQGMADYMRRGRGRETSGDKFVVFRFKGNDGTMQNIAAP